MIGGSLSDRLGRRLVGVVAAAVIGGGVLLAFGASASVPALALAGIVAHVIRTADRLGTYAPLVGLVLVATVAWSAALWIAGPRRRGAMSIRPRSDLGPHSHPVIQGKARTDPGEGR